MSKAEDLYTQSVQCSYDHNHTKALSLIEEALALEPTCAKYAVEKAEILCELNDYSKAISFLTICNDISPPFSSIELVTAELKKIREEMESDRLFEKETN